MPDDTDADRPDGLDEQAVPEAARCPHCGGEPEPDARHRLLALGYLHDDIDAKCSECHRKWTIGEPVGRYDGPLADDLDCASCGGVALVHRVWVRDDGNVDLHLKCPTCRFFWTARRHPDEDGIALVGYPQITGAITDDTDPYGYETMTDVLDPTEERNA